MNHRDEVYASTLNLLGSDVPNPPEIQAAIDKERRASEHTHPLRMLKQFLHQLAAWHRYYHVDQAWLNDKRSR